MKKLTAESARQELTKLKVWENDGVLTLKEDLYLEALEIALPVLEQQEKVEGGWVEWCGGDCPVAGHVKVEYRLRDGVTSNEPASCLAWEHDGECYDIIAYRVVEKERERGEEV